MGQRDSDRQRVNDSDVRDIREQAFLRIDAVVAACAIKREFHVFGVHGGSVMERHAVVEHEGIGQPVIGNFPALCEAGDNGSICHEPRQALKHIRIQYGINGLRCTTRGVKVRWFQLDGDSDAGLRRRDAGRQSKHAGR